MDLCFPFHSSAPIKAGTNIYHTHPGCKVALSVDVALRVTGRGEGRQECPFCFVLSQFRPPHPLVGPPSAVAARLASTASHHALVDQDDSRPD